MITHESQVRVRYGETDKMGVVYHGHFVQYFEVSRAELMRNLGFPYSKLEESGVMMPVTAVEMSFRRPAKYDELLTLRATLRELPETRMVFETDIFNEAGYKLVSGKVTLAFLDAKTGRPVKAPEPLLQILRQHWSPKN